MSNIVRGSAPSRRAAAVKRSSLPVPARPAAAWAVSWASGPISANAVTRPSCASQCTVSPNRTASRACRTQYAADRSSSPVAGSPVRPDTTGMAGAWYVNSPATRPNSASIGSMRGEWKAWLTRSRTVRRPRAAKRSASARTGSSAPETTTARGPFTAAIATLSVSSGSTSASVASRATMAPPSGSPRINRPRAATSSTASASESTPAQCAAASSPTECPARNSGRTPQDSSSRKTDTSKVKRAAWAKSVRFRRVLASVFQRTERRGRSKWSSKRAHKASKVVANLGKVAYNSRPIPVRCDPWPVKRRARRAEELAGCGVAVCVSASRAVSVAVRSSVVTAARWGSAARAVAWVNATSGRGSSGWAWRKAAVREACSRRAAGLAAESSSGGVTVRRRGCS